MKIRMVLKFTYKWEQDTMFIDMAHDTKYGKQSMGNYNLQTRVLRPESASPIAIMVR